MEYSFSNIVNQIKSIITQPKEFWFAQKEEEEGTENLLFSYVLPLLMVIAVAVFIGEFFKSAHFYIGFALLKSLKSVVLFILFYNLAVYFTNVLLKTFGGEKDLPVSRKLVAYSLTPMLLVSILTGLFPSFLYVMDILGFYGFYIFWLGGKELLVLPDQKRDSYLLITIVVNFFVFSFLSIILSKLLSAYY